MTDWIGQWVARVTDDGAYLTKWHYVESVIAGEPITHCGRRLQHRDGTTFLYDWTGIGGQCQQCSGLEGVDVAPGDEAPGP